MKNEIVRKLTSLTLMTIMFAGGLTFAFPNTIPEASAAHNANLFVSAENSFSNNLFTGPMVVEVVISDSSIASLDDGHGEPTITINGKKLRMLQNTDGNWYAYFASRAQAQAADATQNGLGSITAGIDNSTRPGKGLNFGKFCDKNSGTLLGSGIGMTETEGFAIPSNATFGDGQANNGTDGTFTIGSCVNAILSVSAARSTQDIEMNVVRENRTVTRATTGVSVGQIGLRDTNYWPFIQLFDFTPTGQAIIKYQKGGSVQTTTLTFDTMTGKSITFDRALYPQDSVVHFTLTDFQLNIDPTDEDSWTYGSNIRDSTANRTVYYQLFNQTGVRDADGTAFNVFAGTGGIELRVSVGARGAQNLFGNLTTFMFESNPRGFLSLNNNTQGVATDVVKLQDNKDTVLFDSLSGVSSKQLRTNTIPHRFLPITITETTPNSGIFTSTDEDDISVLKINDGAARGTSATLAYNDISYTILVGNSFATINMDETALGGEWNSGETIPVTLVDNDANLNSRVDEDLDVNSGSVKLWPTVTIGSPITLAKMDLGDARFFGREISVDSNGVQKYRDSGNQGFVFDQRAGYQQDVDAFSAVARLGFPNDTRIANNDGFSFRLKTTGAELKAFLANGTREGTSTAQDGLFHYLNYDLRSFASNGTNILGGANINITIQDNGTSRSRIGATAPSTANSLSLITALSGIVEFQGIIDITNAADAANAFTDASEVEIFVNFTNLGTSGRTLKAGNYTVVIDLFRFGTSNDGDSATGIDRFNDAIYRLELEETGDNTSTFIGTIEYVLLNQLNINTTSTYTLLAPISDDISIVVHEDLTDEDAVRVNYNDRAGDGTVLPIADQQAAPTHSGVVSFDFDTYKIADTVTVTLTDQDLNVDSEVIDIFTIATNNTDNAIDQFDIAYDQVGKPNFGQNSRGDNFGRLLDITFDDERWLDKDVSVFNIGTGTTCRTATLDSLSNDGLKDTGFTLVETGIATGIFKGDFAVPAKYCARVSNTGALASTTGKDLEVNYVDYRDASGEIVEVGDGAGIRANTGSVSLDRTVYPVPWATLTDNTGGTVTFGPTDKTPKSGTTTRSLFPLHATAINSAGLDDAGSATEVLPNGDVTIHVRVNDADFNASPGSDTININVTGKNYGPVKIMVQRGNDVATLATAGASVANSGLITNGATVIEKQGPGRQTREIGPISEVEPASGIFELDFTVRYTDGPLSTKCPTGTKQYQTVNGSVNNLKFNENRRFFALTAAGTAADGQFAVNSTTNGRHCILQGDILTVEYTDPTDASGNENTVTDSATFDLRNGVLQTDKSVYIIGSDMILTLIEPDFDRDNDAAETYDLDLIEWDSDAAKLTMGDKASVGGDANSAAAFDPEPSNFRETGDSTGIFQIVIEIPSVLKTNNVDRGEKVELEYTDWGPSGANFVGEENQDIKLNLFTSNFGATVELDQKVYTWTDKVFITVVAPDHNFDSNLIDDIGNTATDPLIVQTRTAKIPSNYRLVETGTDTGIFTGEVIMKGFIHDANGDGTNDFTSSSTASGSGPTDGLISAKDNDGLTISFEFNEDETVIGSALIRWNIGEVSWLEASYAALGTGVIRIIDPDMNLNPESVDNFKVDVWSDSDAGGIDLTVSETNESTGIFEGTVFFTVTDESSGHRLRVAEGDTITAEYEDNTLPDPYTTADELEITGTAIIGTIVPPLERAPASNARVVDAFGNSLTSVSVDQQVQVAADLSNGQDRDQKFAYLVQIQDSSGVTVSLAWITGSLTAGQSFSPALSWIPDAPGTYTATIFVWESIDNPTALSPTVETTINVS